MFQRTSLYYEVNTFLYSGGLGARLLACEQRGNIFNLKYVEGRCYETNIHIVFVIFISKHIKQQTFLFLNFYFTINIFTVMYSNLEHIKQHAFLFLNLYLTINIFTVMASFFTMACTIAM